jgi:hypothetical protein
MPLELGIDLCLTYFKPFNDKQMLVLGGEEYTLNSILSDLAGNDPKYHNNSDKKIIESFNHRWLFLE